MTESAELLVVMNEPEQRRLAACLEDLPAPITWTSDPAEARASVLKRPGTRAVVLDAEQGLDWQELAREIRDSARDVAFLIATSEPTAGEMLAASKELPVADMLVKPYDAEVVRGRVERALGGGKRKPVPGAGKPSHPVET